MCRAVNCYIIVAVASNAGVWVFEHRCQLTIDQRAERALHLINNPCGLHIVAQVLLVEIKRIERRRRAGAVANTK